MYDTTQQVVQHCKLFAGQLEELLGLEIKMKVAARPQIQDLPQQESRRFYPTAVNLSATEIEKKNI